MSDKDEAAEQPEEGKEPITIRVRDQVRPIPDKNTVFSVVLFLAFGLVDLVIWKSDGGYWMAISIVRPTLVCVVNGCERLTFNMAAFSRPTENGDIFSGRMHEILHLRCGMTT
jgi:hypothetical protein